MGFNGGFMGFYGGFMGLYGFLMFFFFVGFGNNMIGWGFDGVLCRDFHGGFNGKWPNGDISWDIQPQLDVTCGIFVGLYPAW